MTAPGRYHLTLSVDALPVLDGWWDDPDTADGKFDSLQRQHQESAGAQLLLTEWDRAQEWPLREWPAAPAAAGVG
ncbi:MULTISPECIES: hypothetical protein [unclassified Streptomyces]|uniref:hypothetical protein n=1 Tax=unclassified Streptomyces TaxID=2593676 RepID=UPI002E17CC3E|nr:MULTISPECIES: hypothetical protein [unclassified Streptomyces]